ncbi:hypothetical protein B0H11DRAFT_2363267 [Mycena galericulata]|nr:hypothetical protein B0H11DRAFT_2363267 [Mycena galericulata]
MPLSAVSERAPTPSLSTRRRKRTWHIVDSDDDGPEILSESLPALDTLSLREFKRLATSRLEREATFVAEATAATLQTMQEITEKLQPLTKELETLSGPGWRPNPEDLPPQYAMPSAAPPYEVPEPPNWQPAPPALLPPEPPPGNMTTLKYNPKTYITGNRTVRINYEGNKYCLDFWDVRNKHHLRMPRETFLADCTKHVGQRKCKRSGGGEEKERKIQTGCESSPDSIISYLAKELRVASQLPPPPPKRTYSTNEIKKQKTGMRKEDEERGEKKGRKKRRKMQAKPDIVATFTPRAGDTHETAHARRVPIAPPSTRRPEVHPTPPKHSPSAHPSSSTPHPRTSSPAPCLRTPRPPPPHSRSRSIKKRATARGRSRSSVQKTRYSSSPSIASSRPPHLPRPVCPALQAEIEYHERPPRPAPTAERRARGTRHETRGDAPSAPARRSFHCARPAKQRARTRAADEMAKHKVERGTRGSRKREKNARRGRKPTQKNETEAKKKRRDEEMRRRTGKISKRMTSKIGKSAVARSVWIVPVRGERVGMGERKKKDLRVDVGLRPILCLVNGKRHKRGVKATKEELERKTYLLVRESRRKTGGRTGVRRDCGRGRQGASVSVIPNLTGTCIGRVSKRYRIFTSAFFCVDFLVGRGFGILGLLNDLLSKINGVGVNSRFTVSRRLLRLRIRGDDYIHLLRKVAVEQPTNLNSVVQENAKTLNPMRSRNLFQTGERDKTVLLERRVESDGNRAEILGGSFVSCAQPGASVFNINMCDIRAYLFDGTRGILLCDVGSLPFLGSTEDATRNGRNAMFVRGSKLLEGNIWMLKTGTGRGSETTFGGASKKIRKQEPEFSYNTDGVITKQQEYGHNGEALDKKLAWEADRDKAEQKFWDEHQQRHQQQEALRATVVAEKRKERTDAIRATIASLQTELSKCADQLSRLEGTDALVAAAELHLVRLFEEARRVDGVRRMLQETRCLGEPLDLALKVLHFSDPPLNHFLAPIRPSARFAEVINALRPTSVSIGKRPAAEAPPSVAPSPTKKLRIIPPASPQLVDLFKNPFVQQPCQKCSKEGIPCVGFEPAGNARLRTSCTLCKENKIACKDSTSDPHPLTDVEMVDLGDDLGGRSGAGEDHPPIAFLSKNDDSSDKGEGSAARFPKVDWIHRPRSHSYVPSPTAPDSLLPFALSDLLPSGITSADVIRQGASVANPADDFGLPVPTCRGGSDSRGDRRWLESASLGDSLLSGGARATHNHARRAPPCATTFGRNSYRFIPDLLASVPNSHTTAVPPLMPGVSAMGYWPEFPTDPQHRDELLRWINGEYPGFKEEVANLMRLGLD